MPVFMARYDGLNEYRHRVRADFAAGLTKRGPHRPADEINQEAAKFADLHTERILTHYHDYDWVASVTVPAAHFSVSQRRAALAVDTSLNALRLLAAYFPERLHRAHSARAPYETHTLYTEPDGVLEVAAFYAGKGATAGEGWYAHHREHFAHVLTHLEAAIAPLLDDSPTDELHRRLVDALDWFGQALQEPAPGAAVVKYTAALERLTMTSFVENGIERLVVSRVLLLNQDRTDKPLAQIKEDLEQLYECRSRLMHGSVSPHDKSVSKVLRSAWLATQWSICTATQLFALLRERGAANRRRLGVVYEGGRLPSSGA